MDSKLNVDVSHLTEKERQLIYNVLKRDEDLRKLDEQRINRLKSDLQLLRRRGAIRDGLDPLNSCSRCRCELGRIINRGSLCAICRTKICKTCRVYAREGTQWICIVCHKQLELEAATGEWMNEFVRRASRKRDKKGFVPPSDIVRDLLIRSQSETGGHGCQEKEGLKTATSPAVTTRPRSALSMDHPHHLSPAIRRKAGIGEDVGGPSPVANSTSDAGISSPKRYSEVPIPTPRQKSPLLKQRAIVHNSDSTDHPPDHPAMVTRRPAPQPPHHSDRSDSGIGQDNQPSPKTSLSESIHSRQSSSNSSGRNDGRGTWSVHTESQNTTADSGSDLSDSEVEPSTGVVFRKVTLKRRKRREPSLEENNGGRGHRRVSEEWDDRSLPPPWGLVGTCHSLPRFGHHSRCSPVPSFAWDASCDPLAGPLTRTNSSDSLWWDAAAKSVGGDSRVVPNGWFAPSGLGLAPGLSHSLGTVHASGGSDSGLCGQAYSSSWTADTPLTNGLEDIPATSWRSSYTGSRTAAAAVGRLRRGGSWDELRISSPDYEEDYPGGAADSFSDILCNVTDKIVPEGEEYRIVFISSSSSSKSSGLDLPDGSPSGDSSTSSSRRVSMLMEADGDVDWRRSRDTVVVTVDSPSPPPLPTVPPPAVFDRPSRLPYDEEEFYDYFRDFVDAEWKEESVLIAEESDDDEEHGEMPSSEEQAPPFTFVRTNSLRSSGERSIGEQSFCNQVCAVQSPTSPQSLPCSPAAQEWGPLAQPTTPAVECSADAESSSGSDGENSENSDSGSSRSHSPDGFLPEIIDSSDEGCMFGSYDVSQSRYYTGDYDDQVSEEESVDSGRGLDCGAQESIVPQDPVDDGQDLDCGVQESVVPQDSMDDGEVQDCKVQESIVVQSFVDSGQEPDCKVQESNVSTAELESCLDEQVVSIDLKEECLSLQDLCAEEVLGAEPETTSSYSASDAEDVAAVDDSVGNPVVGETPDVSGTSAESPVDSEHNVGVQLSEFVECGGDSPSQEVDATAEPEKEQTRGTLDEQLPPQEVGSDSVTNTADSTVEKQTVEVGDSDGHSTDHRDLDPPLGNGAEVPPDCPDEATGMSEPDEMEQPLDADFSQEDTDGPSEESEAAEQPPDGSTDLDGDDDTHGETSSDGEKLESDTDSLDTVIEGETFRRMRQVAIREKLVLVNKEWDADPPLTEDLGESTAPLAELEPSGSGPEGQSTPTDDGGAVLREEVRVPAESALDGKGPAAPTGQVTNLHELIAQSRALTATFKKDEISTGWDAERSDSPHSGASVLEKYFMNSLEHLAPTAFSRSRPRQKTPASDGSDTAESPSEGQPEAPGDELVQAEETLSGDGDFGDSWSEDTSETYDSDLQLVSTDGESEATFDEDDSSSVDSTSSDEGTVYLRTTPARRSSFDESWYRLDMSLHTIVEESCEESESERERHGEDRKRVSDPSELERYFRFTFESGPAATDSTGTSSAVARPSAERPRSFASTDDGEYSDTFSESSVVSDRDEEMDDEELARLASSRLEKYFLTGLLGVGVTPAETGHEEEADPEAAVTPTCDEPRENPFAEAVAKTAQKESSSSSKEETEEEEAPFEKNDGCDTIKRKKRGEMDDDHCIVAFEELTLGHSDGESEQGDQEVVDGDQDVAAKDQVGPVTETCPVEEVDQNGGQLPTVPESDPQGDAATTEVPPDGDTIRYVEEPPNEPELTTSKEAQSLPISILDIAREVTIGNGNTAQLLSWDSSAYTYVEATNAVVLGSRGLTLDWKQQSRDSGFIGSSDDLLQEDADQPVEGRVLEEDDDDPKGRTKEMAPEEPGKVVGPGEVTVATVSAATHSPFGLFRSSSTRSNFYAASTTSDDEAQYIVNQLVTQIAKSMSRSPQLARAKPPEIEVFESELAKLMQTVPGIDVTVKEIVEELSSTDYCSDSYESSDYASSDQEGTFPFEIPKLDQSPYGLQRLQRNDSGRSWQSAASTASKSSTVSGLRDADGVEDVQKLPEETMYIYQRFMDSLTKMTEHVSEEAKMSEEAAPATSSSAGTKGSPPTAVKMLHHIRSKLTSLMREVQADRSPRLGQAGSGRSSAGVSRQTIVWNKPGSGSGSAAGDELSISSTSSTNFDSEDSPTDTELSMDSDEAVAGGPSTAAAKSAVAANARALAEAQAHIKMLTKSGDPLPLAHGERSAAGEQSHDEDEESVDGLERWSSDMTIVDDDVRFSSVHKSEPILSLPNVAGDDRRHSRELLSTSSKTLPLARLTTLAHPDPTQQGGHQRNSVGSLYSSMESHRESSKSEWDMPSSARSASSLIAIPASSGHRTPYKHKSCDPLPSVRTKYEPRAATTTPRDKKKHGLAFMLRQKSGSSTSLRETNSGQETKSIKQQMQFCSSLHLQCGKSKEHLQPQQPQQQQQQQQRSSSLHRLFWGGHRNRESPKKGGLGSVSTGSVPSVKNSWSSPEGLSRVGVDVTTAAGVNLSDTESGSGKGSRPSSAHFPLTSTSCSTAASTYAHRGAHSAQDLGASPPSKAKASTLPRSGSDLHANISFLHQSRRNLTSTNTLPHYCTLVPQSATDGAAKQERPRQSVKVTGAKTVIHVNQESPKFRREVRSWPDESNSPESSTRRATTSGVQSGQRSQPCTNREAATTPTKSGIVVPSVTVAECPERTVPRVGGTGSHTGSSDPDSVTEEDIDRLVALHKNRSLSSLGVCSESMSSVYSAAGGGHYGTVTIRGEVQFGLSYNYVSGALEVHIKQCRELAPVDSKRNRSDPYVKVYLLPDKSKSGKRKTRVRKHTLNPTFNEILKFHVTISELETRTLWLTVWHSDMFGRNEFLGEVTLPMGYEAWDDTSAKWYMLQERLGPPEEVYSYKGDLVVALKFVPPDVTTLKKGRHSRGALHVLVKEARNLMAVCANGTSDPFCKSYLLPDKGKSNKQKTHVVKRTCNPKWNHTFVYEDITIDELRERCLELTVWDYDRLTSNDFLGGVRLSLGTGKHRGKKVDWIDSRGDEVTIWQSMLDSPNIWIDGTILLRPTMDHRQATW